MIIEHVHTKLMIADPLTKGIPIKNFKDHVTNMGLGVRFVISIFFFCMYIFSFLMKLLFS